jgi:hypothetical protein
MNLPSPQLQWTENDEVRSCRWHAENGTPPPKRVQIADDRMSTEVAYKLACEGTALLWRGDFQNAKQLLQALARRIDKKPAAKKRKWQRLPPKPSIYTGRLSPSARGCWPWY